MLQAGGKAWEGVNQALNAQVQNVILAGLAAVLDQAKAWFPELDPDRFIRLLNKFSRIGDVAARAVREPYKLASTFGRGVKEGFEDYFQLDHLIGNLAGAFFNWLFDDVRKRGGVVPELPQPPFAFDRATLQKVVGFVLGLLGLTGDAVLGVVREELGPTAFGVLVAAYELIAAAAEGGLSKVSELLGDKASGLVGGGALGDAVKQAVTAVGQGDFGKVDLKQIFDLAVAAGLDVVKGQVTQALVTQLFSLLEQFADVTGISAVLQSAYKVYKTAAFVLDKIDRLTALVEGVANGVDALLHDDTSGLAGIVQRCWPRRCNCCWATCWTSWGWAACPSRWATRSSPCRRRCGSCSRRSCIGSWGWARSSWAWRRGRTTRGS